MILRKVVDVIRDNLVVTFLSVALFAFVVSTIALAVENSDKRDEIIHLRAELNHRAEATTTVSPQEYSTTTTEVDVPTTTPSMETSPATTTTQAPTTTEAPLVDYRLPTHNIPKHYDLWLYPKLEEGTFEGRVIIDVETVAATNKIVLHRYLLDITDVKINPIDQVVGYGGFTFDNEKDFLIISTLSDLQPGKQTKVTIEFKGQMDNKIVGLYSSSYLNEETKER
ncbi:hypothetical protein pipiens_018522, partial [Culex pipiens pipiens]